MIKAFLFGCWFNHGTIIRERDEQDRLVLRCERCGESHRPDLAAEIKKGPAHKPRPLLGEPITRVKVKAERSKIYRVG